MLSRQRGINYVSMPQASWHNLGCFGDARRSMYRQPTNASIVVHRILSVTALRYAWDAARGALPKRWLGAPDIVTCIQATNNWKSTRRLHSWCRKCTNATEAARHKVECLETAGSKQRIIATRESCMRNGALSA